MIQNGNKDLLTQGFPNGAMGYFLGALGQYENYYLGLNWILSHLQYLQIIISRISID